MPTIPDRPDRLLVALCDAIQRSPIPTSPLPSDPVREALGLNLLALALRLDHIDRLSESLRLVDATHLTRSVEIDLSTAALTADQRAAVRREPRAGSDTAAVWLPVARLARTDLAPVVLRDATGAVLSTMTHRESMQALSRGLRRAFMYWLDSTPAAHHEDDPLYDLRHRPDRRLWLIEAAIDHLIENGIDPPARPGRADAGTDTIRSAAVDAVQRLFAQGNDPLLRLLEVAATEQLLVAAVGAGTERVYLRYDAAVLPALDHRDGVPDRRDAGAWYTRLRAYLRRVTPPWALLEHEFTVAYETVIPRAVSSYHVTVEVPEEMRVRRILLTSDNDAAAVRTLVSDLRALSSRYDEVRLTSPELLELELESIVSRAAELGRRRGRDLTSYRTYLADCYATFTQRRPRFRPPPATDATSVFRELRGGHRVVAQLARLAELYDAGRLPELVDRLPPGDAVLQDRLSELCRTVEATVGWSLGGVRSVRLALDWRERSLGQLRTSGPA